MMRMHSNASYIGSLNFINFGMDIYLDNQQFDTRSALHSSLHLLLYLVKSNTLKIGVVLKKKYYLYY